MICKWPHTACIRRRPHPSRSANRFLTSKQRLVQTEEIAQRTFNDYYVTCERLIGEFAGTVS